MLCDIIKVLKQEGVFLLANRVPVFSVNALASTTRLNEDTGILLLLGKVGKSVRCKSSDSRKCASYAT